METPHSPPPPPKSGKASKSSWIALICGILPLIGFPIIVVVAIRSFDLSGRGSPPPIWLLGGGAVLFLVMSIIAIVTGIMGLSMGTSYDRGWTRLRAGFGIGLGVIGLFVPCGGGFFGFAAVTPSSMPPTIHAAPPATTAPVHVVPPPLSSRPPDIPVAPPEAPNPADVIYAPGAAPAKTPALPKPKEPAPTEPER